MVEELDNSKDSGEKGTKDAVESSVGSGEAAGERLSQEGFPSREESKQTSSRNDSPGDQLEKPTAAATTPPESPSTASNSLQRFAEQQATKPGTKNLPNLQLDASRTAEQNTERRSPATSLASSVEQGSRLLSEMTISNNSNFARSEELKKIEPTDNNAIGRLTDNMKSAELTKSLVSDSVNKFDANKAQGLDKLTSANSQSVQNDFATQAARKSDFQSALDLKGVDRRISDSLTSDAIQKANSKELAAFSVTSNSSDLSGLLKDANNSKTAFADKALDNKFGDSVQNLKNLSDSVSKPVDFSTLTANKNEAMFKGEALNKSAFESKNLSEVQRAAVDGQRPTEFKNVDKSLVAEKLGDRTATTDVKGAAEALRNSDGIKPSDAMRQNEKPAPDTTSRTTEQRSTGTESKTEGPRGDNGRVENTVANRASETKTPDEQLKKASAPADNSAQAAKADATKETTKTELAKSEVARTESAKQEPLKQAETGKQADVVKQDNAKAEANKESAKGADAGQHNQAAEQHRHEDQHAARAAAGAAAAAAEAARTAEKSIVATKAAEQQTKLDNTGNTLNRATTVGINASDVAIQPIKLTGDKTATAALGKDILPADNKSIDSKSTSPQPIADKAANSSISLEGKVARNEGAQQISKLADQAASKAEAFGIRGEAAVNAKEVGTKGDQHASGKENSSINRSADPKCLQLDVQIKGAAAAEATRQGAEKDAELQSADAADGDSEDGDNKLKVKRYTVNGNKLYLTGVEISLAALLTMAGAAKLRADKTGESSENNESENDEDKDTKVFIRRTYMVQEGDTLLSIAEDIYNNRHAAWLIADMNAANVKEAWIDGRRVVELQARQILELPEASELAQFTAKQRRDFDPEKLVTVVTQNTVDRELLQAFLGTVSGEVSTETQSAQGTIRASAVVPASQQLPELTIEGMEPDETRFPPATGLGAVITDFATMIKQGLKRTSRDLGGAVS